MVAVTAAAIETAESARIVPAVMAAATIVMTMMSTIVLMVRVVTGIRWMVNDAIARLKDHVAIAAPPRVSLPKCE